MTDSHYRVATLIKKKNLYYNVSCIFHNMDVSGKSDILKKSSFPQNYELLLKGLGVTYYCCSVATQQKSFFISQTENLWLFILLCNEQVYCILF